MDVLLVPFVRGIYQSLVDSPYKWTVMRSLLLLGRIGCLTINRITGDLERHGDIVTTLWGVTNSEIISEIHSDIGDVAVITGGIVKGTETPRCSQGLLNFIYNNLKIKADINFLFLCCADMAWKSLIGCNIAWFNDWGLCYSIGDKNVFWNTILDPTPKLYYLFLFSVW